MHAPLPQLLSRQAAPLLWAGGLRWHCQELGNPWVTSGLCAGGLLLGQQRLPEQAMTSDAAPGAATVATQEGPPRLFPKNRLQALDKGAEGMGHSIPDAFLALGTASSQEPFKGIIGLAVQMKTNQRGQETCPRSHSKSLAGLGPPCLPSALPGRKRS